MCYSKLISLLCPLVSFIAALFLFFASEYYRLKLFIAEEDGNKLRKKISDLETKINDKNLLLFKFFSSFIDIYKNNPLLLTNIDICKIAKISCSTLSKDELFHCFEMPEYEKIFDDLILKNKVREEMLKHVGDDENVTDEHINKMIEKLKE